MSAPPYMKLYVADYLADTTHLGTAEHGAYLLLLMAMWRAGGVLPAADSNLSRLARCSADEWSAIKPSLMPLFKVSRGKITSKRLAEELAKYESTSGKRSVAGKSGAVQKARKNNADAQAIASDLESNCHHKQKHNQRDSVEDKSSTASGALAIEPDGLAWTMAVAVLVDRAQMTEASARKFFGKLLSSNELEARDMLPAVSAASVNGTQDPKSYLTRAAQQVGERRAARLNDERDGSGARAPSDPRRAATEARRSAWADVVAERGGVEAAGHGDGGGPAGAGGDGEARLRLAHTGAA